jgi:glucose/arabinose dehydrogenase
LGPVNRELTPIGVGRIVRARLADDGTRLEQLTVVLEGRFFPRRMTWASDGTLFATLGPPVIRINADGSVPKDNPFVGRADARPEIYSFGLRDVQGLAIHPQTHALWTAENGPRGGDEINAQKAAANTRRRC